ncbi:protein phosphatase 1 regulatory subunit 29 [Dunckerocampus dactyliophorus]|uniref:protein phosphatase 1 regulatory subunit 29 n=1 Tax=Dunckerocampus dactyliophorus TaxID=161453 RepID=UPI0024076A30|nr:protein phosphatase 1 regulatory subunit 29 [Dunckerocampus dactyliophorus]XP_054614393.1 protein phosphatase 1 regulatory subunit 29 [Dunckerocampus dactyliophorus]XP_054614394.1 protein phosphatase 1 regulatory subunit 29 [Dunckerocampus dactyliophorus]XP_054614396.1 protein phosphatase 1 regulatory subunit 29 [Dunckerocampus dactyliophorus]
MQSPSTTSGFIVVISSLLIATRFPSVVNGDCWLIEGDKGYVWLAICSQNQPPYETIPQHINNTVHDLRLNENKLKAVSLSSMYRFTNLTDLNLTKNEISYIEDGAFSGQANLQVLQLGYNKLSNLTEGMMRGLSRMQCLFLQHNLIEVIASNAFWECPSLSSIDLSSNKLARIDPSTFTVLNHLMVCELAANPFHCGCDLYSFLIWLESFNNVTHTYDRLQCETPREMFGFPLLSPTAAGHAGRNAKNILNSHCRDGVMIPGMTSLPPDLDGPSGMVPEMYGGVGPYHQPNTSTGIENSFIPSIKLHQVSLSSASLIVQIPRPFSKMYILTQYNHTYVSDVMTLKNNKEKITLSKLKPHTNYTFCVASIRNSQRYNHTCLTFSTRSQNILPTPSTTTHYIMTIVGCLFGMLIVLGFVYYCLRKKRMHDEKKKSICVKKTILEMRYGPEVAAAVANDPAAVHKLQDHSRDHHQYHHHHGGKLPMSTSSSSGMLHSANTSSSRLSSIPQVEKMATAFSEAMTSKGNYMDIRSGGAGMERLGGDSGHGAMRGDDLRDDDGTDVGEDSEDDGRGSASEISTIAMEVDKVNQIINNCIDALKLDAAAVAASGSSPNPPPSSNPTSPPPNSTSALTRGLITLPQGMAESCPVNKIPPPPPLPALNTPLSERPGISGGGFVVTPPYRPPPPANAVRPIQRQMSADAAVVIVNAVKKQSSTTSCGSVGRDRERGGARVYSLDVPEPRSPDACNQQQQYSDRASPVGCGEPLERLPLVGSMSCTGGGGGGCDSGGVGAQHQENQNPHHYHQQQQQQQLDVQQDYHCSEHRHSVPALYYDGSHQGSPAQRVSFLKPLSRSRRDAASYSQLSPARHHSSYSGYSSSPEYSSESTLRIWERFRPYRKGQRDEACYVTAGNALRKKVQFAKGEDLHDILDYWKGVSAQQKL